MKICLDPTSWMNNSASPMKIAIELDELYEQLGESVEVSPIYVCMCNRRVARRKLDEWP